MSMLSKEAVEIIAERREDSVVICTMTTLKWLHQLSPSPLNLSCAPLMGGASGLGLGIALARPERRVFVLDGDGSLLMQLGSLATIAGAAPGNLFHFLFENGVWFENQGNLPIPAQEKLDFAGMATAAGYAAVHSFDDGAVLRKQLGGVLEGPGPAFIRLGIEPEREGMWSAENPQPEMPDSQFVRMGDEGRTIREELCR